MAHAVGHRDTLETRLKKRDSQHRAMGRPDGWADEMLDWYLQGETVPDICDAYGCNRKTFYNIIAKAALLRVMKQNGAKQMEDVPDLCDGMSHSNGVLA